jgi:hypothetical protein
LTLAASVVLTLSCFRLIRDNATVTVAANASGRPSESYRA